MLRREQGVRSHDEGGVRSHDEGSVRAEPGLWQGAGWMCLMDAQGVSGPSSSCVWNPRVFADDARGWQCPFVSLPLGLGN